MLQTGGPVSAFMDAVQSHDLSRLASSLAPDVTLSIPPLHYTRLGADDVLAGIEELFAVVDDLRYDLRSRYLTSDSVTDEAVLLCRPARADARHDRTVAVPVRVMAQHDGVKVTRVTVWPDVAALRAAMGGAGAVIDLTRATSAEGTVTALRASLPHRRPRVIVAAAREAPEPVVVPAAAVRPAVGPSREVPKAPIPKSVRRRRGILAGGTMLVAAGALASWVAVGALRLPASAPGTDAAAVRPDDANVPPAGSRGAQGNRTGTRQADDHAAVRADPGSPGGTDSPGETAFGSGAPVPPASQLAAGRNTVIIGSDLLFATDSDRLTPTARTVLADLIAQAHRQERRGTVTVSGYTDTVGGTAYNLSLSRRRAAAVATVLRRGLTGTGMTIVHHGHGEAEPVMSNDTPQGRQANRRVTVTFPPPIA